ncbi:DUF92 domain-containing protein [soil metagenome]|nr:DUF92 domain-containing protein [Gemmatimonadales bacterium]
MAYRAATLTGSGAVAAWLVGATVLYGTGWAGGGVLAAFFVSSSLASRGAPPPSGVDPKGDRRDHRQVLANGGVAAAAALLGLHDSRLGLWLLTCALAAAAADTWATATGARSAASPRLILGGRMVPPGTSGGITPLGTAGGAAGATVVAAAGAIGAGIWVLLPVAALIGFGGMVLDSVLGAVAQGRFRCAGCAEPSEWRVHRCGHPTVHQGGLAWLDNDGVNLTAGLAAAGVAWAAWVWLCPCS